MDEYDAPRKIPVEHHEELPNLKEIEEQTCLLFEEFLNLDDAILDAPLSASQQDRNVISDSPVISKQSQQQPSRGLVCKMYGERKEAFEGSDEDDVVSDSAPEPAPPPPAANVGAQAGPDDKMKVLARELAKAGDKLVKDYGNDVQETESMLTQLLKQEAANLSYERFSTVVDGLIGKDKDWTSFVFAFCIGRRICKHSQEGFSSAKNYFQRYYQSYSTTVLENGGMESFLRNRGSTHKTPQ